MSTIKIILVSLLFLITMLPAKLHFQQTGPFKSFNIQPGANGTVLVQWEMIPAADTFPMKVERSSDQKKWARIADVTFQSAHRYFFTDSRPGAGINYYRAIQVGDGGQIANTMAKWVQISQSGSLYIWPNPAIDMLYIQTPFTSGHVDIIDSGGRRIFNVTITALVTEVPIDRLSKGLYFIHVIHGKDILIERFMK